MSGGSGGWAAAAIAVVGVAIAGCVPSGSPGPPTRDGGPPRIVERWTSCAAAAPEVGAGRPVPGAAAGLPLLDDTFTPVAAVLCGQEARQRPGGGHDLVVTERRADEVTALVAALRLPDEPPSRGACTADLVLPPWLALLDERGRWLRPGIPADGCGKPRVEVRAALDGLRLSTVSTRTVREIESAEAAAAGCAQQWADMVAVQAASGPSPTRAAGTPPTQASSVGPSPARAAGPPPIAAEVAVRLCVYRVPAPEQGGAKPAGEFAYGRVLPPDRWASVARALAATGPAAACATPAGRFALLRPAHTPGPEVYVELDGCQRVLVLPTTGDPSLTQTDHTLTNLLT
ncbi:hypothetical protein ABTX15_13200 [Micromonospora sp. NPDC094482]|uniref:hypothetical protein n=1 Tax=unclassified Micromonospora TaxID=2617518 RepID=UPI00332BE67D